MGTRCFLSRHNRDLVATCDTYMTSFDNGWADKRHLVNFYRCRRCNKRWAKVFSDAPGWAVDGHPFINAHIDAWKTSGVLPRNADRVDPRPKFQVIDGGWAS